MLDRQHGVLYTVTNTKSGYAPAHLDPEYRRQLQETLQWSYRALKESVQATVRALKDTAELEATEGKRRQSAEYARLLGIAADRLQRRETAERIRSTQTSTPKQEETCYLAHVGGAGETLYHSDAADEDGLGDECLGGRLLMFAGKIGPKKGRFMVDSGATGNFIAEKSLKGLTARKYPLKRELHVTIADGSKHSVKWCVRVPVRMGTYTEQLELAVLDMDLGVDCILDAVAGPAGQREARNRL